MYFDTILVPRYLMPKIEKELLEHFRECEESFQKVFFYIFTFVEPSSDDVWSYFDQLLSDVDWVHHELSDNKQDSFEEALWKVVNNYMLFHERATPFLNFLRDRPSWMLIDDIEIHYHDAETIMLKISFDVIDDTIDTLTEKQHRENTVSKIYNSPYRGTI